MTIQGTESRDVVLYSHDVSTKTSETGVSGGAAQKALRSYLDRLATLPPAVVTSWPDNRLDLEAEFETVKDDILAWAEVSLPLGAEALEQNTDPEDS